MDVELFAVIASPAFHVHIDVNQISQKSLLLNCKTFVTNCPRIQRTIHDSITFIKSDLDPLNMG